MALIAALPQRVNLALGLSTSAQAAATLALSSLAEPFSQVWEQQRAAPRSLCPTRWARNCAFPPRS